MTSLPNLTGSMNIPRYTITFVGLEASKAMR